MLLHRAPLLTPTPTPFERAYYAYSSRLRMALSNPVALDFYFKKGSLTERRFQRAQWERERAVFGERLAGKKVDVGDIPAEEVVQLNERDEADEPTGAAQDGDKTRIERVGAGDLYLLVKDKASGQWGLPVGGLQGKEALHEVSRADGYIPPFSRSSAHSHSVGRREIARRWTGQGDGYMARDEETDRTDRGHHPLRACESSFATRTCRRLTPSPPRQTFIFKSHILTGSPALTSASPYSEYAWLTKEEIREVLGGETGGPVWSQVEPLLN